MMKAGSVFETHQLQRVGIAFNRAWNIMVLRGDVRTLEGARQRGRETLARTILTLESSDEFSVDQLVSLALEALRVRPDAALRPGVRIPYRVVEAAAGSKPIKPKPMTPRPVRRGADFSSRLDGGNRPIRWARSAETSSSSPAPAEFEATAVVSSAAG